MNNLDSYRGNDPPENALRDGAYRAIAPGSIEVKSDPVRSRRFASQPSRGRLFSDRWSQGLAVNKNTGVMMPQAAYR